MSAVYSRTWYDDTCVSPSGQPSSVIQKKNFDFCIIGGGLAGLSCAYHLAEIRGFGIIMASMRKLRFRKEQFTRKVHRSFRNSPFESTSLFHRWVFSFPEAWAAFPGTWVLSQMATNRCRHRIRRGLWVLIITADLVLAAASLSLIWIILLAIRLFFK